MPYLVPEEETERLNQLSNSAMHRLLTDYRATYAVFNQIASMARNRIKALQSLLMRRGLDSNGTTIPEEPNSLKRPVTGGSISEHAMLRYLERVHGIDLAAIETEMADRLSRAELHYGGAVAVDEHGFAYIMREDGLVKSVLLSEWISEIDGLSAQESFRIQRRRQRDDHFREVNRASE